MNERSISISLSSGLAWLSWATMVALLTLGILENDIKFYALGCCMSAVAATLHIRCFFIRLHRNMRSVFELGRDAAGTSTVVRSVH